MNIIYKNVNTYLLFPIEFQKIKLVMGGVTSLTYCASCIIFDYIIRIKMKKNSATRFTYLICIKRAVYCCDVLYSNY